MFIAVMMCLGFAGGFLGCETQEEGSPHSQSEKIAPEVEETIPPRIPPGPAEGQPQESQWAEMTKVTWIISDISPDTGRVRIRDAAGMELTLTAGLGVDLKDFSVGDQVVVEYTRDMVIKAITQQ
jgi:hypothetical protein